MKKHYINYTAMLVLMGLAFCICITSCKKQNDWLDAKRNKSDVTPSTLKDFQAILDGDNVMNQYYPIIGLLGTDNSYITDANLNSSTQVERNSYLWEKDIYQGASAGDWNQAYKKIEYANIVLDGLQNIDVDAGNQTDFNQIRGSALFHRAFAFYNLAQLYCKPYTASTASTDLGIPIRLSSDVNIPSVRTTVQATYNQILSDLQAAVSLLPVTPLYTTRPSQVATNALLAKVYLNMEDYDNAGVYANRALTANSTLLDYNGSLVTPNSTYRFPTFTTGNPEILFYAYTIAYITLYAGSGGTGNVDPLLYKSYSDNDLRKSLYFVNKGNDIIKFQGTYTGSAYNFAGIANNEIYLIRAESYARSGNTTAAIDDLNTLLIKRWKTGTYVPYMASTSEDVLKKVLSERRKELPFTSLIRWEDLRRLNKDPIFQTTVIHNYNGTTYTLLPNDKRYVYSIPDQEIQLYGLQQNER